jgi:hypothetical protein
MIRKAILNILALAILKYPRDSDLKMIRVSALKMIREAILNDSRSDLSCEPTGEHYNICRAEGLALTFV